MGNNKVAPITFKPIFLNSLLKKKLENMYCSTICDVIYMSYTIVKEWGPNRPTRGMKMGSDGPQIFFGGPGHYFCD